MDLIQVDVIGAQATQAGLGLADQVLARGARMVDVDVAHGQARLGGDQDPIAYVADRLADQGLALAAAVHVGGVDQVHAVIQRQPHHRRRLRLTQAAHVHGAPELHRPQRERADDETAVSELAIVHGASGADFNPKPTRTASVLHFRRGAVARHQLLLN
jgi:hypothetical protein